MSAQHRSGARWVAAIVMTHLIVTLVHGIAHARAEVPLSAAANIFVFVVILGGPLLGLLLLRRDQLWGPAVIATTLSASFVFGLVNHFVLASPDHVAHVAAAARPMFAATAVMLTLTEAAGVALSVRLMQEGIQLS